jgi:hypothetical protein
MNVPPAVLFTQACGHPSSVPRAHRRKPSIEGSARAGRCFPTDSGYKLSVAMMRRFFGSNAPTKLELRNLGVDAIKLHQQGRRHVGRSTCVGNRRTSGCRLEKNAGPRLAMMLVLPLDPPHPLHVMPPNGWAAASELRRIVAKYYRLSLATAYTFSCRMVHMQGSCGERVHDGRMR